MKIVQTIGKWAEKSMFTYQIFNAYVRFRQRMNAKKIRENWQTSIFEEFFTET